MQVRYVWNSTVLEAQEQTFLGNSQSPHSRHTVATQSPLQSPLQNTIVATEFSGKKGPAFFANQKLVATTVFSSGDCSGDCVATVWRLCGDCARLCFSKPSAGMAWRARRVPSDHTLLVSQAGLSVFVPSTVPQSSRRLSLTRSGAAPA